MKKGFFLISTLIFSLTLMASEFSDNLLDEAVNEFANKNYTQALDIIEKILELEPDNREALMYKKTIESVSEINNKNSKASNSNSDDKEDIVTETNSGVENRIPSQMVTLATLLSSTTDYKFLAEQQMTINLGLPVINLSIATKEIDHNITDFNTIFPFNEVDIFESFRFSFGIGVRYQPEFLDYGFFDINIGMVNYSNINYIDVSQIVIPKLGFNTELKIIGPLWIGACGNIYINNYELINSYDLQAKAGFKIGAFNLGAYYKLDNISSLGLNQTTIGIISGLSF